jgi:hypothetical protein
MTSSLAKELSGIHAKIDSFNKEKGGVTLQEARDLYFASKKKIPVAVALRAPFSPPK